MRHVATNVREAVVAGSGHWLMEERPVETVALIRGFLTPRPRSVFRRRSMSSLNTEIQAQEAPELPTFVRWF